MQTQEFLSNTICELVMEADYSSKAEALETIDNLIALLQELRKTAEETLDIA